MSFDEIGRNSAELIGPPRETGTEIRVGIDDKRYCVEEDVINNSAIVAGAVFTGPANAWAFGMIDFRQLARQCDRMSEKDFAAQFGADIGRDIPLAEITDEGNKKLHGQLRHSKTSNPKNTTLPGLGEDVFPQYYYGTAEKMVEIGRGGFVPATVEVAQSVPPRARARGSTLRKSDKFRRFCVSPHPRARGSAADSRRIGGKWHRKCSQQPFERH